MSRQDLARDVGRLLRTVRERRGLTQGRLAERVGASQQWLSQIERGVRNPTLADLERFFAGVGMRLRFEAVRSAADHVEDPDLLLRETAKERVDSVSGLCYLLRKVEDVPHLVGGRLAAMAHGLPVRVQRLDLLIANDDLSLFADAMYRYSTQRWSERWQAFCDHTPPHRPGPMRWLISNTWELRVTLVDDLPGSTLTRFGDQDLWVPTLPWLEANDLDVADLLGRLKAAGWAWPAARRGGG